MIEYQFNKTNQQINKVTVTGHANYSKRGTDIVCAAVSTALIVTANAIETLEQLDAVKVTANEGFFEIIVQKENKIVQGLLKNLEYTLNELEAQYHSYIKNQKEG